LFVALVDGNDEHSINKQTKDEANFHLALFKLRERFPTGVIALFETSDQATYGFHWLDVLDADDVPLAESLSQEQRAAVNDQLSSHLADLDWDGVMGEDEHGVASVLLSATREV
jgi:hypothetical protein